MTISKEHREFHAARSGGRLAHARLAIRRGSRRKFLPAQLDEKARTGNRTRLLRFQAGARTDMPFVHDYWEEVILMSGDLVVGDEKSGLGFRELCARTPMPAVRPASAHGPFRSGTGVPAVRVSLLRRVCAIRSGRSPLNEMSF